MSAVSRVPPGCIGGFDSGNRLCDGDRLVLVTGLKRGVDANFFTTSNAMPRRSNTLKPWTRREPYSCQGLGGSVIRAGVVRGQGS